MYITPLDGWKRYSKLTIKHFFIVSMEIYDNKMA
jgi:hypothetical protein